MEGMPDFKNEPASFFNPDSLFAFLDDLVKIQQDPKEKITMGCQSA